MATIHRECCGYCMWHGPVNQDGTMRRHYASDRVGLHGRRVQVKGLGVCPGSQKPFARFGVGNSAPQAPAARRELTQQVADLRKHHQQPLSSTYRASKGPT